MTTTPAQRRRTKSGLGPLIRRIHFYAGIFIGPFILVAALSGALYGLAPSVEKIVYQNLLTASPTATPAGLQEQIDSARQAFPDLEVSQVWPAAQPGETTRVVFADESLEDSHLTTVFIDPDHSRILGDKPTYSNLGELPLRAMISIFHRDLLLGQAGQIYVELAASWLWFVALGGVYLWLQRVGAKRLLSGLAPKKKNRAWWVNLHGLAGMWLVLAMLLFSATGLTRTQFSGHNVAATAELFSYPHQTINTVLPESTSDKTAPEDAAELSAQAEIVWLKAQAEGLQGPLRLFPPEDKTHAWTVSQRWGTGRVTSDELSIDGKTGTVIDRLSFSELPLLSRLLTWGVYLHHGVLFGLFNQILLFITGLALAGLVIVGYGLWWNRKPTRAKIAGIPGQTNSLSAKDWVLITAFLVTVGTFLPTLGLSLLAMLIADRAMMHRLPPPKRKPQAGARKTTPKPVKDIS